MGFVSASDIEIQPSDVDESVQNKLQKNQDPEWFSQDLTQKSQSSSKIKNFHTSHSTHNNILTSPVQTNKDQSNNFKAENSDHLRFTAESNSNLEKDFSNDMSDIKPLFEEVTPSKISTNLMQLTTDRAEDGKPQAKH